MKHAFLLLTHFPPAQTYELLDRLASPDHIFVIHYDKKTKLDEQDPFYQKMMADKSISVLTDRVDVQWGGYSTIIALLNMIREALKHEGVGYLHDISGQCLPVKSIDYIHRYFEKRKGSEFIEYIPMPQSATGHSVSYQRVDKYHLYDLFSRRSKKTKDRILANANTFLRNLQKALKTVGIYRRYPADFPPLCAGSAWWSLTADAGRYITDYVDSNPAFLRRFRYTQLSDEVFLQTLMANSPFKNNIAQDNLRFIDFSEGLASPKDLGMEHLPEISKPDAIFARKFTDKSKALIAYLDKEVYREV